jgi:NAD-dependent SIR2 family protein deacetylase
MTKVYCWHCKQRIYGEKRTVFVKNMVYVYHPECRKRELGHK